MSELKKFSSDRIYWAVEQVERVHGDIADLDLDNNLFYIKSEADKVIAKLKESVKDLILDNYLKDKELRHQKYKRCLAMARIAQDDWHLHNSFYAMGHQEFEKRKCEFYEKWHKRWLAIAEKFKTNSTAQ